MIKESKLSLEKELKIDSQFTVDRNNPDHNRYISTRAITVLLGSAITEKEEEPKIPNIEENGAKPCSSNGNIGRRPIATVPLTSTNGDNRNHDNKIPVVTEEINNGQAAMPSKENFYTSLTKDVVGVVITGLFIAAAVMVPFVAGAAICGIIAALGAVCTGLHIKKFTLPSYREMEKNKVEHVSSKTAQTL